MTREDERKLYEAYDTLDKLLNTNQSKLKLNEIKDIVHEFNIVVTHLLGDIPMKPTLLIKAQAYFDKFCKDFIVFLFVYR